MSPNKIDVHVISVIVYALFLKQCMVLMAMPFDKFLIVLMYDVKFPCMLLYFYIFFLFLFSLIFLSGDDFTGIAAHGSQSGVSDFTSVVRLKWSEQSLKL